MGYDVHITKKDNWWDDDDSNKITFAEWLSYVSGDSEMQLDNFAEAKLPDGQTIRIEQDGIAVWLDYSSNGKYGNYAWFTYYNGEIVVKNPDKEIVVKMAQIAKYFNAKVQGDDGEFY